MSAHILIIEDEKDLALLMADYAHAAGFRATIIGDGQNALNEWQNLAADCIVLDLMLPKVDGLQICQAVRAKSQVPIIMVTAKVEEIDRLLGLESGADDYLCKPFSPRELIARIKVILRRAMPAMSGTTTTSATSLEFRIEKAAQSISLAGAALDLTRSEFLILQHFIRHPSQVFSRLQLLDIANEDKLDVTDRAIDSHIKNLRKKIHQQVQHMLPEANPIHSIYGLGYRFDGL